MGQLWFSWKYAIIDFQAVRCSHPDYAVLTLRQILKSQILEDSKDGQEIILPFVNACYKANVRVVGYYPHDTRDFAVGRVVTDYDMLSDCSGGDESTLEEEIDIYKGSSLCEVTRRQRMKVWEWRFALEVEDAGSRIPKERIWLQVDNHGGQALLDLDAAK